MAGSRGQKAGLEALDYPRELSDIKTPHRQLHTGKHETTLKLKRSVNRLPWLDGIGSSRNMPGEFEKELVEITAGKMTVPGQLNTSVSESTATAFAKPMPRLSLGRLPEVPGSFDHDTNQANYSPSLYDSARRFDLHSESQTSFPRKDPASYERLVQKPFQIEASSAPMLIPTRSSSLAIHPTASSYVSAIETAESGDIGMVSLTKKRSYTDGNLSSEAPSTSSAHRSRPQHVTRAQVPTGGVRQGSLRSNQGTSMNATVEGLQGLMDEAMRLAQQAATENRTAEVTAVFEETRIAMRKASHVGQHLSQPLRLSEIELPHTSDDYTLGSSSDSGTDSSTFDLSHTSKISNETAPTEYSSGLTSLQSPRLSSPFSQQGRKVVTSEEQRPRGPQTTSSDSDVSPSSAPGTGKSISTGPTSSMGLPKGLQKLHQPPSADSIVIDFAYVKSRPRLLSTSDAIRTGTLEAPRHFSVPRVNETFREDVHARPEDIEQIPFRSTTSEEKRPKLKSIDPSPIIEPSAAAGGSFKRRKPRRRHVFQSRAIDDTVRRDTQPVIVNETIEIVPVVMPISSTTTGDSRVVTPKIHTGLEQDKNNDSRRVKYKRRPIAREWNDVRKRVTAVIACINTALIGLIAGIYAGEVPKIQYQLADTDHLVILGNVLFYIGLGITTLIAWPLPLLHGRKPYVLIALACALPLQFPQALAVSQYRSGDRKWFVALLLPRLFTGLALGFAYVNFLATLFDLFGASLQSHRPHQEFVDHDDLRRQGGGVGLWLGFWAWCFVGSLAVGFLLGAVVTAQLAPAWGFYFVVILLAVFMLMNIVAPETRRAAHRRSILHYFDEEDKVQRKIARGEVKLHLAQEGPKFWWEEVWAGMRLMVYMLSQVGFAVLALYIAWIYALVVLVTLLLGALLSTNYLWRPEFVGLGVFALALGALMAVPLTKANLLSRDRSTPARTDSMTFQPRVTWTSHFVRRCIFTFTLPIAGLAFTLTSPGPSVSWVAPTIMSATVGFLSTLAIAECVGLVMETYDTCDLQPGVNSKHRQQSLDTATRRRRTSYSSYPRVIAGLFAAQGMGFFLAAAATGVSGRITRALGAQAATGVVAGILLFLTILLSLVLWRFRTVQVIPNHALGTKKGSKDWTADDDDKYWRPVVLGNPSGKVRRMNMLETGKWSRWTEIRRLNKLVKPGTWEVQK